MTLSLVKYDKKALKALSSEALTRAVDKFVRDKFESLEEHSEALQEAISKRRAYKGSDPKIEHQLSSRIKEIRKNLDEDVESINNYVIEQRELFRSRGVSPDLAYTWAIVPVGDHLANGVEMCRMVRRRVEFDTFNMEEDEDRRLKAIIKPPSEKSGLIEDESRGKYRDGGMIIEQMVCSMDRSELY